MKGRMSWVKCDKERVVIFDNSAKTNTTNLRQLIRTIADLPWGGKKVLVLGNFDYHEHSEMEDDVWRLIGVVFSDVVLVGREAFRYREKIINQKRPGVAVAEIHLTDTLKEGSKKTISLADSTDEKCYITVTAYAHVGIEQIIESVAGHYEKK